MKKRTILTIIATISALLVGCKKDVVPSQTLIDIDEHNIMLNTKPKFVYIDMNDGSEPYQKQVKDYSDETKTEVNVYSRYSLMVPTRSGFVFRGFSLDREGNNLLSETETTILDNYSTIYANWMPVPMNNYILQEGLNGFDLDLGTKVLPIAPTNGSITAFVPYQYKEVMLDIAFKSNLTYQSIFISGRARDDSNSYSFNMNMQYAIRMPTLANLYNIEMININYTATDLNRIENFGQMTTLGCSIGVGFVQSFREAYIKIK